jgi:hypothetical protein
MVKKDDLPEEFAYRSFFGITSHRYSLIFLFHCPITIVIAASGDRFSSRSTDSRVKKRAFRLTAKEELFHAVTSVFDQSGRLSGIFPLRWTYCPGKPVHQHFCAENGACIGFIGDQVFFRCFRQLNSDPERQFEIDTP